MVAALDFQRLREQRTKRSIFPEDRNIHGKGHARIPDLFEDKQLASKLLIIKLSGKLCTEDRIKGSLGEDIKQLVEMGYRIILLNGGGKPIDEALEKAGIKTKKEKGIRITPKAAIPHIEGVMAKINDSISRTLRSIGIDVVGIDGVAYSPIKARKLKKYTGDVEEIDTGMIKALLRRSDVLVLSCLGKRKPNILKFWQKEEQTSNINADTVANALAIALKPKKLIIMSDKPVLDAEKKPIFRLSERTAFKLISEGTIDEGMALKVKAMLNAAAQDVKEVIIAGEDVRLSDLVLGDNMTDENRLSVTKIIPYQLV